MNAETTSKIDPAPFYWALTCVVILAIVWYGFQFFGEQRFGNTALWQGMRPVVMTSPPQTVQLAEVRGNSRNAFVTAQTERGVYFLSGTKHVPATGDKVVVQANDHWEIYLCALSGERCITIHSFCADATLHSLVRNEKGQIEGCYAPNVAQRRPEQVETQKTDQVASGPGKRMKRMAPAVGASHPREWAWRMGLPTQVQ